MRKSFIARLADLVRTAFYHPKLRVIIDFSKGIVRIDARSTIAIAAAVLIIGMVMPRDSDRVPPTHTVPPRESVIWLAR